MPNPSPTDPLAVLRSLIDAFDRGASTAAPPEATPHLATATADLSDRLSRIEERLARLEARAAAEDMRREAKRRRKARRG